jgi:4-amino-4-deoxy-L-arabinose transferase-like glycosyltransferase
LKRTRERAQPASFELPTPALLALIFTAVFLAHGMLLRLPYFWDEAGYYIPAARDLLGGSLIPHSTIPNPHPPLVMAWLALWWKLSGYTPAVTRTAMLLVSAFGLLGVYRLARTVSNSAAAIASTLLMAVYPVWFAQSSLAQLDVAAAAFTIWAVNAYLRRRLWSATALFALAALSKETAVVAPFALVAWELLLRAVPQETGAGSETSPGSELRVPNNPVPSSEFRVPKDQSKSEIQVSWRLLLSLVPLAAWFLFLHLRTGHLTGNAGFFRYNLGATLTPLRIVIAIGERLWHAFGYMNLFALTVMAPLAMMSPPVRGRENERISIPIQFIFLVLVVAYILMLSVLGGAVLARYMLPVIPLVIIVSVSTLRRRVPWWKWLIALALLAFVAALVANPLYRSAPEDNLNYANFVRLHKRAAEVIQQRYAQSHVLTAWPASDELTHPYLGYVKKPVAVVRIDNFTLEQITLAMQAKEQYDIALLFSTKLEPEYPLLDRFEWWRRINERFFDYHRDLPLDAAARMLGGTVTWQAHHNGQWVAIVEFPRIFNARAAATSWSERRND